MFKTITAILNKNNKAAGAIASIVQSFAIVIAGIWLGWVFYYSEILKPSMSETFLLPTIELVKVGVEKDEVGQEFYVFSLKMDVENKSGQKRFLASSYFVVNAYKFGAGVGVLSAKDIQEQVNKDRGGVSRYRDKAPLSEVVYAGSELAHSTLAVGERASRTRFFRVPVGRFNQVEANWYVVSGTNLDGVNISQVALADKDYDYDYVIGACVCKGECPDISKSVISGADISSIYCKSPWFVTDSQEGIKLFGDPKRNGKFTATSLVLIP